MLQHLCPGKLWGALTSREGLRQDLGGEGSFGAAVVTLLLKQLFPQDVPPAAIEEAVQDVRGDHLRQGQPLLLQAALQDQGVCGEH